jgi:hypothetical protein
MKTYEPLKSPEYKRNELGQFDRPGKTLAKTQKKTGLVTKTKENKPRGNPNFRPGHNLPGPGRPPGSQNKTTIVLKEAILRSLEMVGGEEYLARLAIENSSAYASLLGKVLPTQLAASDSDGGLGVQLVFRREIVWPDGRKEIERVTPKTLPAPDAAFQPDATCTRHED